jgi:hypothetical protein
LRGDLLHAIVGIPLRDPPVVGVFDADSNPIPNAPVSLRVVPGGVQYPNPPTAADGLGQVRLDQWVFPQQLGTSRVVLLGGAAANPLALDTVAVTTVALPPSVIVVVSGDSQTVTAGPASLSPILMRVQDAFGRPDPFVDLGLSVNGGGHLQTGRASTDSAGIASLTGWSPGTIAGVQQVTVTANYTAASTLLTATVLPGPPVSLFSTGISPAVTVVLPVDSSVGPYGVRVEDQFHNPVPGVPVHFAATIGGGRVSDTLAFTQANGQTISVRWTLGPVPGTQQLRADTPLGVLLYTAYAHTGVRLTIIAGDSQHTTAGSLLPVEPAARLEDAQGAGVPGVPVAFSPSDGNVGGPPLTSVSVVTDAQGEARAPWTVGQGSVPGQHHLGISAYQVSGGGVVIAFVTARPAYRLTSNSPVIVVGTVGQPVSAYDVPAVIVSDTFGNRVAGHPVDFAAAGGGSVGQTSVQTDSTGAASAMSWMLGTRSGAQAVTATAAGLVGSPAVFTVQAFPGPPAQLTPLAGDGQTGLTREILPVAPGVVAEDVYGNPVATTAITFSVPAGGGRVDFPSATTDALGRAYAGKWRLGPLPGVQSLIATSTAVPQAAYTLTATATQPPPVSMTATGGTGQSVRAGAASRIPLAVQLVDARGYGVPAASVDFAVSAGGGSIQPSTVLSDSGGVARGAGWVLGAGANTITATVAAPPLAGVSFTGTGQPAPGGYGIELIPVGNLSAVEQQLFAAAVQRWTTVVTGDVADVPVNLPADLCLTGQPAVTETVDDLLIFVQVTGIDGPGGILGGSGVCVWRTGGAQPAVAVIVVDQADIAGYPALAPDIVLHEMGHALGIGTAWAARGLVVSPGTPAVAYVGAGGETGYWAERGAWGVPVAVPVEYQGGAGTADVHWSESALGSELMTGYINSSGNPLSVVSIGALQDLGYAVDNAAADAFGAALQPRQPTQTVLAVRERPWAGPVFEITPDGRLIPR